MHYDKYLKAIAIGVSYRKHFAILDKVGAIVDDVLYSNESFFNPTFFPKTMADLDQRILFDDRNGNTLTITSSNVIFEFSTKSDDEKYVDDVFAAYKRQIFGDILLKYKISGVSRIGYVMRFMFHESKHVDELNSLLTKGITDEADTCFLRLTRKIPSLQGVVRGGIEDFRNSIVEITKEQRSDNFVVSIDYQQYYSPFLDVYKERELTGLVDDAKAYSKRFLDKIFGARNE